MSVTLVLPAQGRLRRNNAKDPLPYYYRPLTGALYRRRLTMGLELLPDRARNVLEVGVGSGILVPSLTRAFPRYTGLDLELAPGLDALVEPGCAATFHAGDLLASRDIPGAPFDAILCLSVLEHIADADAAARALVALLAPDGVLVAGYPMVNRAMSAAFAAIGYPSIDDDHVSPPARIHAALSAHARLVARRALPPRAPVPLALYQCAAWRR